MLRVNSFVIVSAIVLLGLACNKENTTSEEENSYQLVWAEEFDIDGPPDPKNWRFEEGFVRNKEAQWYQAQNASVKDGLLIIEGRRDTFPNPNYDPNSNDWRKQREYIYYTSSSLKSEGLHNWTFGRFEIRAKIIAEEGLWPAIWTLGEGIEWPQGGEIDIMEYYDDKILANAAWAGAKRWQAIWDAFKIPVEELGTNWDEEFHIWRMDWTAQTIKLYVDDQLLNTISVERAINQRGSIQYPFKETKHYILLNLALGGNNGGNLTQTTFPSQYQIDYVRVYQMQ